MSEDARLDQHVTDVKLHGVNRGGKTSIAKVGGRSPGKDTSSAPASVTQESCVDQHGGHKALTSHGKSTSVAVWHQQSAVFEVIKPRGDALRSTVGYKQFLLVVCVHTETDIAHSALYPTD